MSIIALKPSYIPLMQKRFCCAAAVLQMIVYRNGYGLFDQEEVARELGVKISAEDISAFSKPMPLFTKLNFDEGLKTVESEEVINQFFKNHSIALCARAVRSQNVPSMEEFLKDNILGNRDIWVEYHNDETRDSTSKSDPSIHDGLVESYNLAQSMITLINPSPTRRQRLPVTIDTLGRAISNRYGRATGFIVISQRAEESVRCVPA